MKICNKKAVELTPEQEEEIRIQSYFDRITPSVLRFYPDYYICGNNYCSVWAIREYAPKTQEQAILSHIADHENVTLKIYNRPVSAAEQNQIIEHADRKNNAQKNTTTKLAEAIDAESNLSDMVEMLTDIRRNNESMVHTSVFIQLKSSSKERLTELQADISMELIRSKISYDRLLLQQKEGFIATLPFGRDMFGNLFERVMPISSAANLYPLNYSGKTDEKGLYIGKDKYGSSICVDFDVRSDDKTNSNIVILGNAGEGKSFLLKLILTNLRESGFDILNIDPNVEYVELTNNLGGVNIDLMGGKYTINPLEPTPWATDDNQTMLEVEAFSKTSALSQHISYLKDFFRCYKDFSDAAIDTLEIMLGKNHIIRAVAEMSDIIEIQSDKIHTENPVFENIPLPDNPPIVHENDENIKEVINKQTADTEENLKEETAPTIDPAVGGIAISLFGQLTRMMTQDSNIDQSQFVNHSVETEILRKVLERKLAQGQKIE